MVAKDKFLIILRAIYSRFSRMTKLGSTEKIEKYEHQNCKALSGKNLELTWKIEIS